MSSKKDFQKPGVVLQPHASKGLQEGINLIANTIRPTLGPLARTVLVEKIGQRGSRPEILDSGGTIVRRIYQIKGRDADMGAMLLRHILWSLQEHVGDGTATAAVIFQTIYNEGLRYIVSGGNAMRMRACMEELLPLILTEIDSMTIRIRGKEKLFHLAQTISNDPPLSKMMGEIFDIIGEYGRLEIRSGRSRELEREYVEGIYWNSGLFSSAMINDPTKRLARMEEAAVLITDLEIKNPEDIFPLLDLAVTNKIKKIALIASAISDRVISILLAKPNREKVEVIVIKTPSNGFQDIYNSALQDLAVLTGGIPLIQAKNDKISSVRLEHLGHVRRIWAQIDCFCIVGGKGDPRQLRRHINDLRNRFGHVDEKSNRKEMLERIGKLMGGAATLWIGGTSPIMIEARKELAERTAEAMRGAMREGVVPGGGVALLDCRKVIRQKLASTTDTDEVAVYRILLKSLEMPTRILLENSGFDDYELMPEINNAGISHGFDVVGKQVVNMIDAGIFDSASVVKAIVHSAITGAFLALTTDVLIHRKRPPESIDTA